MPETLSGKTDRGDTGFIRLHLSLSRRKNTESKAEAGEIPCERLKGCQKIHRGQGGLFAFNLLTSIVENL